MWTMMVFTIRTILYSMYFKPEGRAFWLIFLRDHRFKFRIRHFAMKVFQRNLKVDIYK